MFQVDSDFVFDKLEEDTTGTEFVITPNTSVSIRIYTNNGAMLLEYTTGGSEGRRQMGATSLPYVVDSQGYVDLPVVGRQYLAGYTIREAQDFLTEVFNDYFNETFVIVTVESRRVMIYNGSDGKGTVVNLSYNGISIIEAITMAGGLASDGDAGKVRLIRKVGGKQEVYQIDLSKIEGIKYANTSVESGDIIYVQPVPRLGKEILTNITPIVSIISTVTLIYLTFSRLI